MDLKSCVAYLLKDGRGLSENAILEILKAILGTKERNLVSALKDMKKKKEIVIEDDLVKSTAKAKRRIPRVEKVKYNLPFWHRNWTVVIFNIPEEKKGLRDQIRYQLKKHGFALWKNSVWISPHPLNNFLKRFFANHNLNSSVKVFKALISQKDEEELVKESLKLAKIKKEYQNFIKETKRSFKRLKNLNSLEDELKEKALDLLAKITELKYLEVLKKDPRLPRTLLGYQWIGLRAYKIYQQLDKYLRA